MAKKKAKKKHIETDIQKAIVASCQRPNIWLMRVNSGLAKMGKYAIHLAPAGTADVIGWKSSPTPRARIPVQSPMMMRSDGCDYPTTVSHVETLDGPPIGRFVAIEVKVPGEHPTEIQQKFLDKVANAGGISGCAHSVIEAFDILGIAHS